MDEHCSFLLDELADNFAEIDDQGNYILSEEGAAATKESKTQKSLILAQEKTGPHSDTRKAESKEEASE